MERFDLVVIGGGAAGLTASGLGAMAGARTLMVERHRLGGDCTWTGCVPSKTLLKAAKVAWQARTAARYGLVDAPIAVDRRRVMEHVRRLRQEVYADADAPPRFEALGVTVRHGEARFVDPHTIEVAGDGGVERVRARYVLIAAGGRPAVPDVEGLRGVPFLTSENRFARDELPRRIAIVGAGPIGTEMAQALCRLGAEVVVINRARRILAKDDPELAAILREKLEEEGVTYLDGASLVGARREGQGLVLDVVREGGRERHEVDALLVAAGRRPNVEGLGLEAAGVRYGADGVSVDDRCRTNVRHVYAAGDVTGRYQFTHMSEHMAKVAATNALLKWPMKIDRAHVPWVTYTDPELAHVGATEAGLRAAGKSFTVYRFPFAKIDRAITDGETTGWIKVLATKRTGKILGATILGENAGDLIGELALAMRNGLSLRAVSDTIHPYPTLGLGVRRAADQWYVRGYNPLLVKLLQKAFGYRGGVLPADPDRVL